MTGASKGGGHSTALDGLRVVDLTRVLGGPYATMALADLGADVIKVEPPEGDDTRRWGPPFLRRADGSEDSSYFLGVNRNKRSIAIDLNCTVGRDVLHRLLERADVLVENFLPGTMERWGLGYREALMERYPRIIHCRISGFGADGPLGGYPGYDAIVQALVGLMSINGDEASGPTRMGTAVVDMATGLYSALAILAALHERSRSGLGQFIDMTLHDCGMTLLHPHAANYFLSGIRPLGTGNPHPNIAPYETYRALDATVFICSGNERQFHKLCQVIGREDLPQQACFSSNRDRVKNRSALTTALGAAIATMAAEPLCNELLKRGVPAGIVRFIDQAVATAHTRHREMVVSVDDWTGIGSPLRLSRTPGAARSRPPMFSEHTAEILRELGYSEDEERALRQAGALHAAIRP